MLEKIGGIANKQGKGDFRLFSGVDELHRVDCVLVIHIILLPK